MSTNVRTPASQLLGGDYPLNWAGFIGQKQAKDQLMTAARAARKRKVSMAHTLLESGRPGIGKTTLALLAAAEMRAGVRIISGKVTIHEARMVFAEMQDRDVLIIDEIHQMVAGNKVSAEWLLHYLQDGVLMTPMGPEEQPAVTIIGCTTESGKFQETVLKRFDCKPEFVDYTEDEGTKIAQGMAKRIFTADELPVPTPTNCRAVALAASFDPRVIRAILHNVRDISIVHHNNYVKGQGYDLTLALSWLGLTADGLTSTCQRYLKVLLEDFGGAPAGEAAMQDRLQEPGGLHYTERLLMDKGLISKSTSGRVLTQPGVTRAREIVRHLKAA